MNCQKTSRLHAAAHALLPDLLGTFNGSDCSGDNLSICVYIYICAFYNLRDSLGVPMFFLLASIHECLVNRDVLYPKKNRIYIAKPSETSLDTVQKRKKRMGNDNLELGLDRPLFC